MIVFAFVLWIPISVLLFAVMRPARAATMAYVCGWLVLPATQIKVEGFWDIDKTVVIAAGVMLGALLCCRNPLVGLRPNHGDVLVIAFAAVTGLSSVANGLGTYDGASTFVNELIYYGVAFGCGRLFLRERRDILEVGQIVCYAAGIYALFAVWEWRMSPQLHNMLYGGFQHSFAQHKRWGFYRPVVCFPHALSLGMFFAGASLLGVWMYLHRLLRPFGYLPAGTFVVMAIAGLVCSMSMGPWLMFFGGSALLWAWRTARIRGIVVLPLVLAALWMGARYTNLSDGEWLVSLAQSASSERAESLQYRIDAETVLLDHAQKRPWCGWGGWGRNVVFRDSGKNAYANDALWVIVVGRYGLLGVVTFYLWWGWPTLLSLRRSMRPESDAVVMALLVLIGMETMNTLFNGVMSPLTIFLAGGTTSVLLATEAVRFGHTALPFTNAWPSGVRSDLS